ncbi:MAG: penicillin-binding protein activator [Deltaproteobacteria bacterium]|jgi:ABC-type branched-subunit amino acid transport system substrate-binding protein/Tfp pilus assembly protein PilF|nr:penicillin-binding protein activator [Deltaproteobacteria bacterium]MCW8892858.1 penicillin-binding protein activator [Deltaproteobacteria bacterium]MCW9049453.1 penicillin-binding protein activator [Deltaproteobacteria bacterium]
MKRIIYLTLLWTLSAPLIIALPAPSQAAEDNATIAYGQELYQAGDLNQALAVLRTFIQQSPDTAESARAYALIGRIFIQQRDYSAAILYLQRIPQFLRSPEIELLLGDSLVKTGRFAEGLNLLQPLLAEPLNSADRTILYQALTASSREEKRFLLTLFYLQQQLPFSRQPAALLSEAHDILQNRIADTDLAEAAFMWQGTEIGQDARLQLARRALVQQQPELARQHLEKLLASSVTFPYWQEAELLLQRTSVDNWLSRDSIGVLLPLTGPYASYGELVKKGLNLALQEHNKTRLPIRFIYRDTAIKGVSTAQLVSGLTDDDKVMGIIGPLLGTAAVEAAQRAQREMVPLLALTQTEVLPEIGNFIFRDTLTAEQQVKALVDYAMQTDHISFSILHPENRLGRQMSDLFIAEVQRVGGEIVDVVSYPEDSTDFRKQIQQLLWEEEETPQPAENMEEVPKLEYPLAPFHALFIPDYADRVSQIAPQLVFYGIKDVTLLGINGWNSPELIGRAGRFLKNAVFVDAFFPDSKKPEVQRFVELYRQTYRDEPSILEAQAFDVATLLLQMLDDPSLGNRDDLRRKLVELQNFKGITGTTGFDLFGEAKKELSLLKVQGGRIVEF